MFEEAEVSTSERIAVNAAIEKLVLREDEDGKAARIVIQFGSRLKMASSFHFEQVKTTISSGDEIFGVSPDQGDVTIKDDRNSKEEKTISFGINKDRVGHYRIWKENENEICFHHYWKSDATTMASDGSGPDHYYLAYDPETLEPQYFAILRQKIYSKFWLGIWFELGRQYLEPIYGTIVHPQRGFLIKGHN